VDTFFCGRSCASAAWQMPPLLQSLAFAAIATIIPAAAEMVSFTPTLSSSLV